MSSIPLPSGGKSLTLKLSCCRVLEPLLCMSRITLIHSDHWLPRTSLGELPTGCCPLLAVCHGGGRNGEESVNAGGGLSVWCHTGRVADLEIWLPVWCCVTWRSGPKLNMYSATWQIRSCNSVSSNEFIMKMFVCLSVRLSDKQKRGS